MIVTGWDSIVSGEVRAGFICIACGVLMAIYEHRVRSLASRVPAFAVALIALLLFIHPVVSYTWQGTLYESLLVPPAIGLVLMFSLERGTWLRAFLCAGPVQAVGITSYGIYIWQQIFTEQGKSFPFASRIMPMTLPLLLIVVPMSYFLIEKPAMRYGKILSQRAQSTLTRAKTIA
jgi:peptidoglycan/LPS O-acetylase OafA/YrhL